MKNRLYQRDIQEKYLDYLLIDANFSKFQGLIGNTSNIQFFLNNRLINSILDTLADNDVISPSIKGFYHAVISNYSMKRFKGLMDYQLISNLKNPEHDIDKIYLTVFDQIKKVIEYEVPRLLCLFESIYQQAGRLKGRDMDEFNLSAIIRFFELGVTTTLGIFLIEFGYPIDTIRAIEKRFSKLGNMDLQDSIDFVKNNILVAKSFLDEYEIALLSKAIN